MKEQSAENIRWGIVGIGRHARRFMAPAINQCSTGTLEAVCSRDIQRAEAFSREFGCPLAYDSLEKMLESGKVDAVYVGSPNHVHKSQVLSIAKAGKHVLCDKPLATSEVDCREMIAACETAGVKLAVGFHLRHNPVHEIARQRLASGVLGELRMVEIQYLHVITDDEAKGELADWRRDRESYGGGEFVGTGVHAIDLLRFVTGQEVIRVKAVGDGNWYDSGFEMMVQAVMNLQDGTPVSLSAGGMRYPMNRITLFGSEATMNCIDSLGYYGGGVIETRNRDGLITENMEKCDVYIRELDAFSACLKTGSEANASGVDGLHACQITDAVYEALEMECAVLLS